MNERIGGILLAALLGTACAQDPGQSTDQSTDQRNLRLIAGGLGGAGNTDGIGPAARFGSGSGVAVDLDGHL